MPREKQLLAIRAPVAASLDSSDGDALVTIKGFASVETVDRSGDLVPPTEFNIEKFMLNPQLMVNHKLWIDDSGNGVSAGRVISMHAAELIPDVENSEIWAIKDLKSDGIISTYPKSRIPDLKSGDKGLFVVAEVTIPEIAEKVKTGEFSSFSWRGLVDVEDIFSEEGGAKRKLIDIDLFEISLVNVPDQPDSSFIIGKSLHTVRLEKSRFETKEIVSEYLKYHGLKRDRVKEDKDSYYALQNEFVDNGKLLTMKMSEGVHTIVGPLIKKRGSKFAGQFLEEIDGDVRKLVSVLSESFEEKAMSDENEVVKDDGDEKKEEIDEKARHPGGCPPGMHMVDEKCVPQKDASEATKALYSLGEYISGRISDELISVFEKNNEAIQSIVKSVTGIGESTQKMMGILTEKVLGKQEEREEEKEEEEKSFDGLMKQVMSFAKTLQDQDKKLTEVAKSAEALQKITPNEVTRDERLVTEKRAEDDPNNVMDSLMPFIGGKT